MFIIMYLLGLYVYLLSRLYLSVKGAQAVGMGLEAQKVPAAAELYKRANDILG